MIFEISESEEKKEKKDEKREKKRKREKKKREMFRKNDNFLDFFRRFSHQLAKIIFQKSF